MKVRKGDKVIVIAGNDRGNTGTIQEVHHGNNRVVVEGALEARMPTIQPPDEVEAVTLLSASEPVHEPPDGPAPGQPV